MSGALLYDFGLAQWTLEFRCNLLAQMFGNNSFKSTSLRGIKNRLIFSSWMCIWLMIRCEIAGSSKQKIKLMWRVLKRVINVMFTRPFIVSNNYLRFFHDWFGTSFGAKFHFWHSSELLVKLAWNRLLCSCGQLNLCCWTAFIQATSFAKACIGWNDRRLHRTLVETKHVYLQGITMHDTQQYLLNIIADGVGSGDLHGSSTLHASSTHDASATVLFLQSTLNVLLTTPSPASR